MENNIAQEKAIKTIEGQVLLISCPGSGKTTTMIRRIQAMINAGIDASNIVMVTFTDAAATEMKERFFKQYGQSNATFCTIHSLCLKILSGITDVPLRILSSDAQFSLLHDVLSSVRIPTGTGIKDVLNDISAYKNGALSIDEFVPTFLNHGEFIKIYQSYEEKKQFSEYMDYDDMLCRCHELLLRNRKHLIKCRQKYRYILCDEYQDTNHIQKEILCILTGDDGNICVVGDDDQSIYGFRGANPKIMMDFEKDYPKVSEIYMETNYRSRPEIIMAANHLIENNTERFDKNMKAAREMGGDVVYRTLTNRQDELGYLSKSISDMISSGTAPASIAVLARTNMQLDDVAAEFEHHRIRYSSNDSIKDIYEHFIFADIISYLQIINETWQPADLLRILNKPVRYLREADFRNTELFSVDNLIESACKNPNKHKSNIDSVIELYNNIQALRGKTLPEQVIGIAEQIGYRTYLSEYAKKMDLSDDFLMSKFDYFLSDARNYTTTDAWSTAASIHIKRHKKQLQSQAGKSVTLSTMHRAKGLEWDIVFVIDCCHGSTPISKAVTTAQIEEERRLFYVAITRAREQLYVLNYSQKSGVKGNITHVKESIFINEMKGIGCANRLKERELDEKHQAQVNQIVADFQEGDIRHFKIGMQIHHKTYGNGIIISKTLFFVNIHFKSGNKMFPLK